MEDEMERLRAMLGLHVVQGGREPTQIPKPVSAASMYFSSESDDDEKILSFEHRVGGRLEAAIGGAEVHVEFDFPRYNLQLGEEAPETEVFCALKALEKYPDEFISAANRFKVAKEFFDKGHLYERPWDFFYLHSLYSPSEGNRKKLILIPSRQVQHFLITINNILQTHLKIPDNGIEIGFLFTFPKDGTPRPRYLGHTNEREMAECLKKAIPSATYRPDGDIEAQYEPTEKSLEAFKKKIDLLFEAEKRKRAANKEKKKAERFAKQKTWNHEVKRVQRYLGLRPVYHTYGRVANATSKPLCNSSSDARKNQAEQSQPMLASCTRDRDTEKPAPYEQEDSVIFICVDVEAYERDHSLITEIGIATLDTADITAMSPGEGGENWMKAIRARHFRVKEYEYLKNKDHLVGCPEYFQFGESEWISIKTAPQEISKCFKPPYSNQLMRPISSEANPSTNIASDAKRSIILVGHDVMTDIGFLKKLGYDLYNLSNLLEVIDTSSMYRAFKREPNPRNLGSILANLDIPGWYLHNAGNDAVYTLQAMIGIAIRAISERPDGKSREMETEVRIAESVQNAAEATREAQEGWSSEGSDGGSPITLVRRNQPSSNGIGKGSAQNRNIGSPWRSDNGW